MALEVVVGPQDRRVVSHPPDEHHAHRKTLRHHAGNIDGRMPRRVEPAGVGDHFPSSHDLLLERRVRAWNLRRLDRRRRHHENIELFAGPQGAVTLRDLLDISKNIDSVKPVLNRLVLSLQIVFGFVFR
jgi:hypothetical protein